ncbi:MAG: hypothetical protein ACFCUU_04920 [Cyclobacteriaceae bacterium]
MNQLGLILILSSFTFFKPNGSFKEGYYFKKDGTKVVGLIKFHYGGSVFTSKSDGDCSISFKTDNKAKKVKLTTNDICCFVVEKDSFAIIRNFRLNALVTYPQDFAKVIESGRINLYLYYSSVQQGGYGGSVTATDWVIEKNGIADKLTKKKFKELIPSYLSDYPELLDKIEDNQLGYKDTEMIVKMYNEYMRK